MTFQAVKLDKQCRIRNVILLIKNKRLVKELAKSLECDNKRNHDGVHTRLSERFPNVDIQNLRQVLRHSIKKYLCSEDKLGDGIIDTNIKTLKALVQPDLRKLHYLSNDWWLRTSDDTEYKNLELPVTNFSNGLKEFNQIIYNKLLEWSQFHLDLYEINQKARSEGFYDTTMEDSADETLPAEEVYLFIKNFCKL